MVKNKKELIKDAQELADKMNEKKEVINTILNDLDVKAQKEGVNQEHLSGMALVEQLFTEFDELKLQQDIIFEQIKKS